MALDNGNLSVFFCHNDFRILNIAVDLLYILSKLYILREAYGQNICLMYVENIFKYSLQRIYIYNLYIRIYRCVQTRCFNETKVHHCIAYNSFP